MNRKLLLLAIFFSFCTTLKAQMVYLPDTAWRNFLMTQGLSSCITGDSLDASCPAILGIDTLDCSNRYITDINGISYFTNLTKFNCKSNNLTYLPQLPFGLITLNCADNSINNLGSLPSTLLFLNFANNNITGSYYPTLNLISIDFQHNYINYIGPLPSSLVSIICSWNPLNNLPTLPNSLLILWCDGCNLAYLPTLPSNLITLFAQDNLIASIPSIPPTLKQLYLGGNLLNNLPQLPDSLEQIEITRNQFNSLPELPRFLKYLHMGYNNISIIDSLPESLIELNADSCRIVSLPKLPTAIVKLSISQNMLQTFHSLPGSMNELNISDNPISCLPPIGFVSAFTLRHTNIHCFPQRIQFWQSDIDPDTIPLCDITAGCPVNWNVRGHVNHDLNLDCNHDSSENFLKYIPVILKSSGVLRQISYSTRYGEYSFKAPFGSYFVMVDTASEPFKYNCPVGGYTYITLNTTDSISDSLDFHLKCRITNDKLVKSVTPYEAFRPGRPTRVDINAGDASTYHGTTCFNDTGIVYVILSSNVSYVGPAVGALTPTQIIGDTLIWSIPDFSTIVPSRDFNIQLTTNTSATIGDTVCIQVVIQPLNDFDPTNNIIQEFFPVRASFDPNEKWVSPEVADTSDHEFMFTILFQNTGTAPAYDVYLIDTLDNDLNASTFELIGSSHEVVTSIFPGNILRFNFNAIELPDSNSNEAASHGFVKYKIKRKTNTGAGTEITNTAYIYFDYNAPIVTNTVSVEIATSVGTSEFENNEITIYPNPANQFLTISSKNKVDEIQLFDIFGKLVLSKSDLNSNSINLNVADLIKGVYFINVKENKSETIWNKKVVIY